jgi:hypothetical protein
VVLDRLAGAGELDVAALLDRQVDDHRAGLHRLDHLAGDQPRRRLAGHQRGGDHHVGGGDVAGDDLALAARKSSPIALA